LVDHLFRNESGKMVAVLSRLLGFQNLETAQDIVQDTLLQALHSWRYGIVPDNPSAWLYRVARNKAIDFIRREKKFKEISPQYAYLLQSEYSLAPTLHQLFADDEIKDSQLRMIFACCHPCIPEESQVALVLKSLCGLSVSEIAKAFLGTEDTIAKRIYRAKEKIRNDNIELELPDTDALPIRLDAVLKSIYLLFNEGYHSSQPDQLIRKDLCEEAIRLCDLLTQNNKTRYPRTYALLALMHFQASRLDARLDDKGHIVLLKEQKRELWDRSMIQKGYELLEHAAEPFEISTYHFEAAIASIHAAAPSFEQTDWKSIHHLYEMLYQYQPSPVVALNKAIASAYAIGKEKAVEELKAIKGLDQHHLYYATLGEIYFSLNHKTEARGYFEKALHKTNSLAEIQLLKNKIEQCNQE
jgi:RNA polymerase sigma-70 factor (ECF subfamily)